MITDESDLVELTVIHPDFGTPIRLDALTTDIVDRLPSPSDVVSVAIEDRTYLMTISDFNALFGEDHDAEDTLDRASREQREQEQPQRRGRRRQQTGERKQRVDWSDPERAGMDHPGRVSQREQIAVQELGIEVVNRRRVEAGQEPLDPDDPAVQQRYGLEPAS